MCLLGGAKSDCSTAEWSRKSDPFSFSAFLSPLTTVRLSPWCSTAPRFAAHNLKVGCRFLFSFG